MMGAKTNGSTPWHLSSKQHLSINWFSSCLTAVILILLSLKVLANTAKYHGSQLNYPDLLEKANSLIDIPFDFEVDQIALEKQYYVKNQAMWLLSNMAESGDEIRKSVVKSGFIQTISNFISCPKNVDLNFLTLMSLAILNCLRNK